MTEVLDRITKKIEERGLTKREFMKKLGIAENNYWQWTTGRTNSYMKKLPEIATILDTTIEWLVSGEAGEQAEQEAKELYSHFIKAPKHLQEAVKIILEM